MVETTTVSHGDREWETDEFDDGSVRCPVGDCQTIKDPGKPLTHHISQAHGIPKRITEICDYCGEEFRREPNRDSRRFCSRTCSNRNRSSEIKKTCPGCGEVFGTYPSIDQKYCSYDCYADEEFLDDDDGNDGDAERCLVCGDPLPRNNEWFCSRECYDQNTGKDRVYYKEATDD